MDITAVLSQIGQRRRLPYLRIVLVIGVLVLSVWYVYNRLSSSPELSISMDDVLIKLTHLPGVILLLAVLTLTYVNWGIEAYKWRFLLRDTHRLTISQAYRSVLTGLAFTMLTPFRVGSFIGRVWFFPKEVRGEAVIASVFGGLAQLFVTVIVGLSAIVVSKVAFLQSDYIFMFSFVLLIVVSYVYFFPTKIIYSLDRFLPSLKLSDSFKVLMQYSIHIKWSVLGLSAARYLVFLLQYFMLLLIFVPSVSLFSLFMPLALSFFVISVLPSMFFGIGLRETSALVILGPIIGNDAYIVVASLILWLINMMLPSIIGAVFFIFAPKSLSRNNNK